MLDRKFILENPDVVKENCKNRGVDTDVDQLVALERQRRELDQQIQEKNRLANETAKKTGKASPEERPALIEEGRAIRAEIEKLTEQSQQLDDEVGQLQSRIPNLSHPAAPIGEDDKSNLEVRRGKTEQPAFDFEPKDHVELGEALDMIDFEGGARVAGAGFYFLKNDAVRLELALQQYALQTLSAAGFTPVITPDLAYTEILHGTGYIPRGPETQIYSIENSNLNLVATAEITLGGMMSKTTLDADELPLKICGISHCFRTEAGAAGRASRGLYRVHQFTKVEMFAFTQPDQSDAVLEEFCDLECQIFDGLDLPYRVVDTATGDLGGPAYRKYDLEAWMPGRGDGGEWGEVTSTSNCTDYQARRLNIRFKTKGEKGTKLVHTLNGTAIAISRAIIAIMENNQRADGTIAVPKALQPWFGKDVMSRPLRP